MNNSQPFRRILVVGGAGFLGSSLLRQLTRQEGEVLVIDDLSTGRRPDLASMPTTSFLQLDIRDGEALQVAIKEFQPELVYHLAALHFIPACIKDPSKTLAINVLGTQHLLDALRSCSSPPKVVFTSTADVYRPQLELHSEQSPVGPDNIYGLSKLVGEELFAQDLKKANCQPVVARLFNLYGPGETNPHVIPEIVSQLKMSKNLILGNTSPKRDYVYVDDAAAALQRLASSAPDGSTWNVGTGRSYSVDELITSIENILDIEIKVTTEPSRYRVSDRPNLQSDPTALWALDPDLLRTPIEVGLAQLLVAEGFSVTAS